VASVFAIFLGSRFGFSAALLTGGAAYGVALLAIAVVARQSVPVVEPVQREERASFIAGR
jgi:hypothetical protein